MRIVFIATGEIALPAFRHLLADGPKPLALVTQPDKRVGRKMKVMPPRIKVEALSAGIPVLQPEVIDDIANELRDLQPELLMVMAYGQILKGAILDLPCTGIVNLHASLLPKYRGAACIQAAIDAGDVYTGVCAQHIVRKLDAGDLIHSKSIAIAPNETGGSLHDKLSELAVSVMVETLHMLEGGHATRTVQDEEQVSYIGKLGRNDGRLDWSQSATELERRIRAYDPWPGTYTMVEVAGANKRLKVFPPTKVTKKDLTVGEILVEEGRLFVGTGAKGAEALELTSIQPEGSKRMVVSDYLLGRKPERLV